MSTVASGKYEFGGIDDWGPECLLAADFDETMAVTSEPAPNGMTVALAYRHAVQAVLGADKLERYEALGGLRNRAPTEVVAELMPGQTPARVIKQRSEDLVEAKLDILTSQIGAKLPDGELWPRPTEGFLGLWLHVANKESVTTGVTSSGHQPFIERFCDVQDIPPPDLFVTDDDMRPLLEHLPTELCVKPSRLIIDLLHHRWLQKLGFAADHQNIMRSRAHILGAGDNGDHKDRNLAENAGIEFVEIDPANPRAGWQAVGKLLITPAYGEAANA